MKGKVCLVTGANTGIGRVTALELARMGARVVMMCRSEEKTAPVVEAIRRETGNDAVTFHALDLSSLAKVKASAEAYLATGEPIDVLINNAGVAGYQGTTDDGFEVHFGVNHLGPFLLTNLLLERVKASSPARIVNVASQAHQRATPIDYDAIQKKTKTVTGFPEYQVSKLANVLFSAELARRLEGTGVNTYALHPGVVASDVWRKVPGPVRWVMKRFMITNEEGAKTTLFCATSDAVANESGLYYDEQKPKKVNAIATEAAAKELWARSEAFVAEYLGAKAA